MGVLPHHQWVWGDFWRTQSPPMLHGERCWGGFGPQASWPLERSLRLLEVPITWRLSGTALALEGIPQLTGSTQQAQAPKLPSRSRSSCWGGMRQHCALKSIPDPISKR